MPETTTMADADQLLTPIADITARPIEEVRARRDACTAYETGLSYLRRMVQGPLDVIGPEVARRADGAGRPALAEVLAALPTTFGDSPRTEGPARPQQELDPAEVDPVMQAEVDAVLAAAPLARVTELSDDELAEVAGRLTDLEKRISERRQAFHAYIDELQAELARRYRTGEASVDALFESD